MKNKIFKKLFTLVAVVFLVCILASTASAANGKNFSAEITPYKTEYQKGEEIEFTVALQNNTLDNFHSVLVEAAPNTDGLYTAGVHNRDIDTVVSGELNNVYISVQEEQKILEIGATIAGISALLFSVYAFFIHKYYSVAAIYVILSMVFTSAFSSFPTNLERLNLVRETQELGTASVIYDGQECEIGFKVSYEKPITRESTEVSMLGEAEANSFIESEIKLDKKQLSGIAFAADSENSYFFGIDVSEYQAFLMINSSGSYKRLATKHIKVDDKQICKMRVEYSSDRAKAYLFSNADDNEPYPLFDISINPFGFAYGIKAEKGKYSEIKTGKVDFLNSDFTYTNPVFGNSPDPFVLQYNGVYYLYGTNRPSLGFEVFTSTDLVNWESAGMCAEKGEILGNDWFWAPEVYEMDGKFYMLYTAEEHLAIAASDSPTGPFIKTSDEFIISDFRAIDGNILFDDDGNKYLYFSKLTDSDGQQLWGCRMSQDLTSIDRSTLTYLTSPEGWEGNTNEGPFMIKHNGTYYLTYTGSGYEEITYSVTYATSNSPLGKFKKYKYGPILSSSDKIRGTGHHCFVMSPDNSEMFIVYHCHYSETQVHPRKLCIDRVKFVPSAGGEDIISVYGPTETPQPMPSSK